MILCSAPILRAATIGDMNIADQPVSALTGVKSASDVLDHLLVQVKLVQHTDGSKVYACAAPNAPGLSVKFKWKAHEIDNERELKYDPAKLPDAGKYSTNGTLVCWPPDEATNETSVDMVVSYKGTTASHSKVCPSFENDDNVAPDVAQTSDTLTHIVITRVDFQMSANYSAIQPIVHYRNDGDHLAEQFYIQGISVDNIPGGNAVVGPISDLKPNKKGDYFWGGLQIMPPGTYAMTFYVIPINAFKPTAHMLTRQRRGPSFTCTFTIPAPASEN